MSRLTNTLSFIVIILATLGCSDIEENFTGGAGYLSLEVTVDDSYKGLPVSVMTPVPEDFSVSMVGVSEESMHTWSTLNQFPQNQQYLAGEYSILAFYGSADNEGVDSPYYTGKTDVTISDGALTQAHVVAELASSIVTVEYTEAFQKCFTEWNVVAHARGGKYVTFEKDESRPAYLLPGDISLIFSLTLPTGVTAVFQPATILNAESGQHYHIKADVTVGNNGKDDLIISIESPTDSREIPIELSDELFNSPGPSVTSVGFDPDSPLLIREGTVPTTQVAFKINSSNTLTEVILTTKSAVLQAMGWPAEVNLLNADEQTRNILTSLGLKTDLWDRTGEEAVVDISEVFSHLLIPAGFASDKSFSIVAKDILSKVNKPSTLVVRVEPVDLTVLSVSQAIMGINKATIKVQAPSTDLGNNIEVQAQIDNSWQRLTIDNLGVLAENSTYDIVVNVPEGSDDINIRILYSGTEKARATIKRCAPEYSVEVDPFSSRAHIKIDAADQAVRSLVTRYIKVYLNDRPASILERDPSAGTLIILGLSPLTSYTIKTALVDNPSGGDYTTPLTFTTEGTPQLPNSDFEEVKETIVYDNLLSGGKYSQNTVEIYNRQNAVSLRLSTPIKGWGNTNAKTFCMHSSNQNTWYMQPSVFTVTEASSGGYATEIRSVGFDPDGEKIPDYLQQKQPFTPYSMNIPNINYHAAGKLFLGEYSFDWKTMQEIYTEGISFGARPLGLSGEYKYFPCSELVSDCGVVKVEVTGFDGDTEIALASGMTRLPLASTYTSFTVPLTYKRFGIKARRIKVMFSSSERAGTIAEEQTSVITLDDPVTSSSIGSRLIVDNISLSY